MLALVVSVVLAGLPAAGTDFPPPDRSGKLTKANVGRVKGGMTLAEVMALLGPRAEVNPAPAPFGYGGDEVLVVWRDGKEKWAGVVFVPDKGKVLRVLDTGATNLGWGGF